MEDTSLVNANTLIALFHRRGSPGKYTVPIMDKEDGLRSLVDLKDGEKPVFLIGCSSDRLSLLTTRRIVPLGQAHSEIELAEIRSVEPCPDGGQRKEDWNRLKLTTKYGKHHILTVEGGKPYFGVWSVLLNIVRRNHLN